MSRQLQQECRISSPMACQQRRFFWVSRLMGGVSSVQRVQDRSSKVEVVTRELSTTTSYQESTAKRRSTSDMWQRSVLVVTEVSLHMTTQRPSRAKQTIASKKAWG